MQGTGLYRRILFSSPTVLQTPGASILAKTSAVQSKGLERGLEGMRPRLHQPAATKSAEQLR